jgi:hypothetical protein
VAPEPVGTGDYRYRHQPAQTDLDRNEQAPTGPVLNAKFSYKRESYRTKTLTVFRDFYIKTLI